jgi:LmbE family N-acetylglucosaminyl deacetylase
VTIRPLEARQRGNPLKHQISDSGPALLISPHLDDAVLSCGQLISTRRGSTIVTVLAGFPLGAHAGWSAQTTGLPIAKDANLKRREEDQRASLVLGAQTVWGAFLAREYESVASASERAREVQEFIAAAVAASDARSIFLPLGVTHPDHVTVSDAALFAVRDSKMESYIYMDMPYGQARPDRVWRRLRHIRRQFTVEPVSPYFGDQMVKREAVNAYSSQVAELQQGFGRHFKRVFTDPERYWRLSPSG